MDYFPRKSLSKYLTDTIDFNKHVHDIDIFINDKQGLKNPLARHPGLVISTFGLAEIISCMPDVLVKIYIGY